MSNEYDKTHPAEHSAHNGHGFIVNPPPLARRIVAFTIFISTLASLVVLFVAVPKGIKEYVEAAQESSTSAVPTKGSLNSFIASVSFGQRESCAISLAPNTWMAAADEAGSATTAVVHITQQVDVEAKILHSEKFPHFVVVTTQSPDTLKNLMQPLNNPNNVSSRTMSDLSALTVQDCFAPTDLRPLHRTPVLHVGKYTDPVYVMGDFHGVGAVLNKAKIFVGLVYIHQHAEQLIALDQVATTLRLGEWR